MSINEKALKETFLRHPDAFTPNVGLFSPEVIYFIQREDSCIFFLSDRIVFDFAGAPSEDGTQFRAAISLVFEKSNADASPHGISRDEGVMNFYLGNDPKRWRDNVNTYQQLTYQDLWPGVDLLLSCDGGKLKCNWTVRPGANPAQIVMRYLGADSLELDGGGNLAVRHALGTMTDARPVAFQALGGVKTEIACSFHVRDGMTVEFDTGTYDETAPLYIDPAVSYTTYLGGSAADSINDITAGLTGTAYFAGQTASANFPTVAGAYQAALAGTANAFITQIASDGASLIYSTYLGGSGTDAGLAITVDPSGAAYVTGSTTSADFPTMGPYQGALAGTQDAFIAKLSPNGGALYFSTYLGGAAGSTTGRGIGVNIFGQTFIAGETSSPSFPTTGGAFSTVYSGGASDGFVSLLSSGGGSLLVSTYLGGSGADILYGLSLDSSDFVYVVGSTDSADFPTTTGAFQTALAGTQNAFVTKFIGDLSAPVFSTYLGGAATDAALAVTVDSNFQACVTGSTTSSDFPVTAGVIQTAYAGAGDAFATKFSLDGGSLIFSTYLGGSGADIGNAIALDTAGHVWLAGSTTSADFPTTPTVIASSLTGTQDWFISMLSADGSALLVSYYLGGTSTQTAEAIAIDTRGALYVAGSTSSADFPASIGAFQTTYGGGATDGAATKANFATFMNASVTIMQMTT